MPKLAVLTPDCMTLRTTLLPSVLMHPGIAVLFVLFEWKIRLGRFVDALRHIHGFWSYLICFITLKMNNLVVLMASLSNFSYHGLFSIAYTAIRAAAAQPPPPPVPGPSGVPPSTAIPAAVDVNWSNESK
jgi:hypothetical protein